MKSKKSPAQRVEQDEDDDVDSTTDHKNEGENDEGTNEATDEAAGGGKRKRKRKRKKKSPDEEGAHDADKESSGNQETESPPSTDMVEHTVYVEGIPFDATPDQVKEFFHSKGGIEDITELRLPMWQDSGRLRGYGHILFGSLASYEKALKLSGEHLGKRYLTIQAAHAPRNNHASSTQGKDDPPPSDCRTLFVNNLPYDATEEEIANVFGTPGMAIPEDSIRIGRNSVNRQSKGFCYIDFEKPEDAQKIMSSGRRLVIKGRLLRLDWDSGRMKGSYRAESGRLWTKEVKEKKKARTGGR